MGDDAVARVMRVVREREDATKAATRDADKALARLARLDEEVAAPRAVLGDAVARVEHADLLTFEQFADALGVDPEHLCSGAGRDGKRSVASRTNARRPVTDG